MAMIGLCYISRVLSAQIPDLVQGLSMAFGVEDRSASAFLREWLHAHCLCFSGHLAVRVAAELSFHEFKYINGHPIPPDPIAANQFNSQRLFKASIDKNHFFHIRQNGTNRCISRSPYVQTEVRRHKQRQHLREE